MYFSGVLLIKFYFFCPCLIDYQVEALMMCLSFIRKHVNRSKLSFFNHKIKIQFLSFILAITIFQASIIAQQIRIMPLGDSITHGEHGSNPIGGFRDDLADLLLAEGINFDLVGTLNDGTNYYPYHEGHPGKTAEYLANNVTTWLNATSPDMVLLHIGTNDINSYYANTDIRDDIERILENIWTYNNNIPVLLCSLIPRNDNLNNTNTDLCRLVHQLAVEKLAEGKLIRYAGQNEVWVTDQDWRFDYLYDAFHPNNDGYHVMAEAYFNVLINQITGLSQFITDNFDRTNLGMTWKIESSYVISSNKLTVQTGGNYWWKPAVYVAEMDPIAVAFEWGSNVNPVNNGNTGLALHLQSNQTTTNGYLVYKESETNKIKLYLINNGSVTQMIDEIEGKQDTPIAGDQFRVSMYSDFQGYHFTCFVNGNYDGDVIDANNTYSNGDEHFAGIMLAGTANNIVDNFQLIHIEGPAERIYAVWGDEQHGDPETRLADSLVAMVTDINGNPISAVPVSFEVTEGDATIDPPEAKNHFEYEAEAGDIIYPMQVMNDGGASGGKYVEVPQEYPDDSNAKVVFTFIVAEEADFIVWGRVQSGDYLHDSFKVIMDEQPEIVWHISGNYSWNWDQVYELNGNDPVIFHLTAGIHTLGIKNREWGSKLDKVTITSDLSFNPSSLQKLAQPYYVTNSSGKAHAIINLGTTPGIVKIKASSPNFSDYTIFTATLLTDKIPSNITIFDGNNQVGSPNQTLPKPLVVEVRDTENQVISNIGVKFEITQGIGASLGNNDPVLTNSQGRASTTLTLGPNNGTYLVRASCPGFSVAPVTFQATATNAILSISGFCKYYSNNISINNAEFKTSGTGANTATSNNEGFYRVQNLEVGGNYTVTPERATFNNWSSHLITTYQAALTLRNAVGLESFTSSQTKAADVDKSGTVTAYDAALIAQFAVGLPRLADSHIGEWIFSPAYRSYYNLNSSYQNQDYTGILLGDVTGDWDQSYGQRKETVELTIAWLDNIKIESDKIIIPIEVDEPLELLSWQLHLRFDPKKLQLVVAEKGNASQNSQLIKNYVDGNLYLGMYGSEAVYSSESLVSIMLKILDTKDDRVELEVPFFQVNNNQPKQGCISLDLNGLLPRTFALLQNYPNPFNPATTITYQIPESGNVKMVIYNLAGQEIITLENRQREKGTYEIEWNGLDLTGKEAVSGVYFCYLHYRDKVKTIKLLKVK